MRGRAGWSLLALAAALVAPEARADLTLAPGPGGGLGAMLVAGPVAAARPKKTPELRVDFELPEGLDLAGTGVQSGSPLGAGRNASIPWRLVSHSSGSLDLKAALNTQGSEATALAFGVLRLASPLKGYLLLGVDDGVAVYLDGKRVFARDEGRAAYPDDDVIPVDLAAGDHPLMLKLHQRGGAWSIRVRLTDRELAAARGASLVLPGPVDEAKAAESLLDLSLERGVAPSGLAPRLRLSARGGWPRSASRAVSASARLASGAELFAAQAGELPLEDGGPVGGLVVRLPAVPASELGDQGEVKLDIQAGPLSRSYTASARPALIKALERAEKARAVAEKKPEFLRDAAATVATLEALADRVRHYANRGDSDLAAQLDEAAALGLFVDSIDKKEDPFLAIRGARRVAYRSPLDGAPSPFALYVPPRFDPAKRYPLVVALHGMNGKPMNMMRWVFGRDDASHDGEWEDRHPGEFPEYNAFVVAPMAHFNSMYRYVGEEDVVAVMEWAKAMFPVDPARVSITGPSMGGTGTAWVAFRYADRFAAAAPLCGYHSYFIRGDMAGKQLRPWERLQAEERSTTHWALNGLHLPLYIVHGTRDLPVENSGVLIDRYKSLGYSLLEEHPDEGHNVWQPTYEGLKGLRWLTGYAHPKNPARVAFRTNNLRYDRSDWVRIARLERSEAWGEIVATRKKGNSPQTIEVKSTGVAALELTSRDPAARVRVKIDGEPLDFDENEPLLLERRAGKWAKGLSPPPQGLHKRARLSGPIRDVHHEPTVVVYGASDPAFARANEQVARWFAAIRAGFEISYPVVSDAEFSPEMAAGKALVLVGGPQSNSITRALDARLPVHVTSSPPEVRLGDKRFTGDELGAAFVYPNPDQPDRYVVVIAGADIPGTLRAMSLPDMLPDFAVFDRKLAPARGQLVLGKAELLAGGTFSESWGLPP